MHGEMQLVEAQQNSDDKPCLTPTKTDSTRSPSSSCGSPFCVSTGSGLHPYAEKLPRPKVVDDENVDTDNEAKYLMLQELVSKLLFDSSHILSMYSALQKRLLSQSKQVESDANKKFDTAATIGGLTQIAKNYDWFWMDVAEHTDIGPTKLNVADALNPDSTLQLWQFDTQISLNLKTTPELLVKPIMKKIATACREMHGNRLKDFAKLNPIDSVKGVLWGAVPGIGSYNQFGEDGFLSLIRHCNGDEVLIPEGQSVITKKYKACELFLDCFCFCSESPTDPLAHVLQGCQIWAIQVSSPDAKHWIPEGASIWRGWSSKRWCGHMPPRRRIHAKDDEWGENEAQKRVIKMLWFQWCHLNGKSIDAVPIKDFIQAVDVEEFARI